VTWDAETGEGRITGWSDPARQREVPTEFREEDIAVFAQLPERFKIYNEEKAPVEGEGEGAGMTAVATPAPIKRRPTRPRKAKE